MKEFDELVKALRLSREKCPWSNEREIGDFIPEVKKEIEELERAFENKDNENFGEELGDVLMDLMYIAVLAEEKGHFEIKDMIDEVKRKLVRRKPWVFGNETVKDSKDAVRRWNEIKALEK